MKYLSFLIPVILFFGISIHHTNAAPLSGTCNVSPSSGLVPGQEITWSVSPLGGQAIYEYSWTGSEGLSGDDRSVFHAYRTEGLKWAQVTITSGNERAVINCSQVRISYPPLRGSCSVNTTASNERITTRWDSQAVGGDGVYTYFWSGNGVSGNTSSVESSYSTGGSKEASVTISSNGESIRLTCDTNIPHVSDLSEDPITFGCEPQSSRYATEEDVTWYALYSASRRGWEEDLSFRWQANYLSKYTKRLNTDYDTPGIKSGIVRTSDEEDFLRTSSSCQVFLARKDDISPNSVRYERFERPRENRRDRYAGHDLFERNVAKYRQRAASRDGGGCFIATAAYGSFLEPEVETLRTFRDEHMNTSVLGRVLVNTYYLASPPLAAIIEKSDTLRFYTRIALSPVVAVIRMIN